MERFAIKIDKKLKANLYKICRLCGIDNPDMVTILADNNENTQIDVDAEMEMSQKINLLLGLSVTKDDKMPQTMCCLCVDKINDFYEFREMCYATDAQTRKLLGLKNIKKPVVDIKPKVEVKEESIVPTVASTSHANKNANRKRKIEDVGLKDETTSTSVALQRKKLRFSAAAELAVKEEIPVIKKKLRFTALNDEVTTAAVPASTKKCKTVLTEDSKLKREPSPPATVLSPAISNKKLRLAAPSQKELSGKKSKPKGGSKTVEQKDVEIKDEIKEEIKEEPAPVPPAVSIPKVPPPPKLKFGCNVCKERFAAKVNLEAHTRSSHIPKVERYVCTACNEVLSKSFDIKNHQLWHKLSKTPYICGCCGESILNTYAFSRHLREHGLETPPALLVLDRECPQCHTSYATNFLYNIHTCAVKTKRCAGCNRLQRNESEYLRHSAHCAKVYLNYSKHIMPSVEALEDAVRIKNENDVEAAAEEMARLSGLPLDMAPVVQLTRLSSPIIMAANQCVSMTGLDDGTSSSSKKTGKKGVSKKDLKRVDELLKSTLDALVSIKHEPEVHVEPETPGEHSDDELHEKCLEVPSNADVDGLDDFHHNDNTDDEEDNTSAEVTSLEPIKIKQEADEANEENTNKLGGIGGGGLKLKIKKEHGQLNSSIIEQQKSSEKRAEKRKKKKKHKDKEKDKQKLSKDILDDQTSQDSPSNNNNIEENNEATVIRIKAEPQDENDNSTVAANVQMRPQPEATIMTSIPMMQFQIACVSSGVEFNNVTTDPQIEELPQKISTQTNQASEPEDVKPNREELDRMLKISHVSGGITMETGETEETEEQPIDHDGEVEDYYEESNEDEQHDDGNDNQSEHQDDSQTDHANNCDHQVEEVNEPDKDNENDINQTVSSNEEIITKNHKKAVLKNKLKLLTKTKVKFMPPQPTLTKSRNKACKSTSKPANIPDLQISAIRSGVNLEPSTLIASEFTPIFIKPEPLNRGYSDEQPVEPVAAPSTQSEVPATSEELSQSHTVEEQNYISSIDFNNITIKQEKDIEIGDVQITQKSVKTFANFNGIKRKCKQVRRRTNIAKDKSLGQDHEKFENNDDENIENDEYLETDEEIDDEHVEVEEDEDEEEAGEEEEEEEEDEEEEEREYRELEYPPELVDRSNENETEKQEAAKNKNDYEYQESNKMLDDAAPTNVIIKENNHDSIEDIENNTLTIKPPDDTPSFVIASVCSQAPLNTSDNLEVFNKKVDVSEINMNHIENVKVDVSKPQSCLLSNVEDSDLLRQGTQNANISVVEGSFQNIDPNVAINATKNEDTHSLLPALPTKVLQASTHEVPIQLGIPFEIKSVTELTQIISSRGEVHTLDHSMHSGEHLCNLGLLTPEQLSINQAINELQPQPHENSGHECSHEDGKIQSPNSLQNSVHNIPDFNITPPAESQQYKQNFENIAEHSATEQTTSENHQNAHNSEPQTMQQLPQQDVKQPVFKIASVTSSANLDITESEFNNPLSNNDNQEETATIEGVVEEAKHTDLNSQPKTQNLQHLAHANEIDENYENEFDANEDNVEEEVEEEVNEEVDEEEDNDPTLINNLEERQNYQNQEVLTQIRPAALALHPYLEDISSSSNSLLSNSLSQISSPSQIATTNTSAVSVNVNQQHEQQQQQQHRLNTEETDNILNETNDFLNRRRSSEVGSTSGQQLPAHMPTFNFDNINEIAENNNNANIEREQLQDGQQQHQQQQQQHNQQSPTNIQ